MTKKQSPILEHKEEDVKLMRGVLLDIINDSEAPKKEVTEACKLLMRAHHALQIDKSVSAKATAQQVQRIDAKLSKEEDDRLKALLNA